MVFLTLILISRERGTIVWTAFAVYGVLEIFSFYPFGVLLCSGTITWLVAFWLYEYFFTNQSWYTATVLSASALFIYYVINNLILNIVFLYSNPAMISIFPSATIIFQELMVTSILVGSGYAIFSIVRNRSPRYQIFLHT
jgi:hypothetical protein